MRSKPCPCCARETDAFELSENGGLCDDCADESDIDEDQSWARMKTTDLEAALAASEARVAELEAFANQAVADMRRKDGLIEAAESQAAELRARCEALAAGLRDIRWRVDDTRSQLMQRRAGGDGDSLYGIDEWSTPAVNLQRATDRIDALLAEPSAQGVEGA